MQVEVRASFIMSPPAKICTALDCDTGSIQSRSRKPTAFEMSARSELDNASISPGRGGVPVVHRRLIETREDLLNDISAPPRGPQFKGNAHCDSLGRFEAA